MPELKIVFVVFYWLLIYMLLWTVSSVKAGRVNAFDDRLKGYTECMAGGTRKDYNCDSLRLDLEAETNPLAEIVNNILTAFINFATLPFVVQFQTVKHNIKQVKKRLSIRSIK